jgi:glucan phosphoethanolaminetransferase (alkaline phosphatase superfamily)
MAKLVKETIVTTQSVPVSEPIMESPVKLAATHSQTIEYIVYFFLGTLELFLAFRFVLKLMGASVSSAFVELVYGVSGIFILPFEGIFRRFITQGVETSSVLEPATIVAIVVYAVIVWGIVKLVRISSGEEQTD